MATQITKDNNLGSQARLMGQVELEPQTTLAVNTPATNKIESHRLQQEADLHDNKKENSNKNETPTSTRLEKAFELIDKHPGLKAFRETYPLILNVIAASGHAIAGALSPVKKLLPSKQQKFAELVDKWAFRFSKWVVPIALLHNCLEAIVGKRGIEALNRFLPIALLQTVPLHNVNLPYGLHSGIQILMDEFGKLHGDEKNWQTNDSMRKNFKQFVTSAKDSIKKLKEGKLDPESMQRAPISFISGALMILGSLTGFAFARTERDSLAAKITGIIRNLGGLIGDLDFIFKYDDLEHKLTGSFCGIASICGVIQRFIKNPDIANCFSHALVACDNIGFTIWSLASKTKNDQLLADRRSQKEKASVIEFKVPAKKEHYLPQAA